MNKHFMKATEKMCDTQTHIPAPLFRKSFTVNSSIKSATLSISGLGFYLLSINGKNITKGALAPYISNPDDICYYDTYDVTALLTPGENIIGIVLGNGFLNAFGGAVWDFDKAEFRGAPRVAFEFSADTEDGPLFFEADSTLRTHPSAIRFDDLRLGEIYDANEALTGWDMPGFDDSDWPSAIPAETPRGELKLCKAEPIRIIETRKPISITKEGDAYLYDFGINSAGICRLSISACRGQKITMWHGELLHEGKFNNDCIRFSTDKYPYYKEYNQTVRYIASGEGVETYTPSFTYFGFRYVLVEGITEDQATEELLTYLVMSSDLRTIGGFCCSDERVNTLYRMTSNADRSNFYYFPTDCPHREKNGWTGDASMSADHMVLMYDVEKSWKAWLDNIRKAQNDTGALPGIVPTSGWGFHWGNGPTWDSVLFNLPYMLFTHRGDTEVIRENAHAMVRYLTYVMRHRNENGTISIGLGDWCPVGKRSSNYDAPLALTDSVMVMDMARKAGEMLRAVGHVHEADYADAVYRDMRETIRRELIDFETMTVSGSCQSSQSIAIYYGVFDSDEEKRASDRLVELVNEKGDTFDSGMIGLHCIFHVLSKFGHTELAYRMIMRDEYPSYAHLINIGETAMVEMFMPRPYDAASHNHHFLGDISRWFTTVLAGLCVMDSKTVRVAPCPIDELSFAEAWYELPDGKVTVRWERDENGIPKTTVTAPQNVRIIKDSQSGSR